MTIYQRVYLLNLCNRQGRRLFIFISTKCPACTVSPLTHQGESSPFPSCHLHSDDKPAPSLPINRPRQVTIKSPIRIQCFSHPPTSQTILLAKPSPNLRNQGTSSREPEHSLVSGCICSRVSFQFFKVVLLKYYIQKSTQIMYVQLGSFYNVNALV